MVKPSVGFGGARQHTMRGELVWHLLLPICGCLLLMYKMALSKDYAGSFAVMQSASLVRWTSKQPPT